MLRSSFALFLLTATLLCSLPTRTNAQKELSYVPTWAQEAIWYQIFVERFRDGDPSNNPRLTDIQGSWPHDFPSDWQPTPWAQQWYKQESWAQRTGKDFYTTVQMRRYGGDLQGVLDKLDYLAQLGITAIYFNPLNDAPSLHKYDARNYHHIDRNFGPNPALDEQIIASESPADPNTWKWTTADSLFLKVIEESHKRGIKVIMDFSWNHTGITFWAWQDVVKNQRNSKYADWYDIVSFSDENDPEARFEYQGWAGVRELPEFKKVGKKGVFHGKAFEGNLHPEVKQHVFDVTRRWMDPNGDGDPSDGVDGFRLDVAEMVPLGFWREYRAFVRSINPEAFLVGEVWWEVWPERMMDPKEYVQGDVFDAVMNYRWYMPTRSLFATALPKVDLRSYFHHLDSVRANFSPEVNRAMMNLTSSHDAPRFATSIQNKGRYKFRVNPRENPEYNILAPTEETANIQRLILAQQFTYIGAPMIWNGDEANMWGADDPDNRKPLVWDDISYEAETLNYTGANIPAQKVTRDENMVRFITSLIALRKKEKALIYGSFKPITHKKVVAYKRLLDKEELIILLNPETSTEHISLTSSVQILLAENASLKGKKATLNARGILILKVK